jgi:1-acyl-sn-glycerol-3-phosphate acyltransferase
MILLRSALYAGWFYGITIVMCLVSPLVRVFAPGRTRAFATSWARLVLWPLRPICGITWQVTGRENLPPDGPTLIASMHQSAFDTLVWFLITPKPTYVLKRELTRIPLFGKMLLTTGMIPVDRDAGAAAIRGLLRETDRAVNEGMQMVIFPEGTRVAPGARLPLQPGIAAMAARTGLPVVPVVTSSGLYWGRRSFLKHPGTIQVTILPPIPSGTPRQTLMERLDAAFARGRENFVKPVDNSVGSARDGFSERGSNAS